MLPALFRTNQTLTNSAKNPSSPGKVSRSSVILVIFCPNNYKFHSFPHFWQTNLFTLFLKITKNRGVAPFSPSSLIKQCLIENTIYLRRISSPKFSRRTEFLPHFKGSKLSRRKYHITFEISFIIPEDIFSHKPLKVAQL